MRPLRCCLVLLFAALARADDIVVTAPGTIWTTDKEVGFAWSSGTSTFTVRVLVNAHEAIETRSVAPRQFVWKPDSLTAGDEVQVWVYDSAGQSGKTAQIVVQQGGSLSGGASTTPSATKASASKASAGDDGDGYGTVSETGGASKTGGGGGSKTSDAAPSSHASRTGESKPTTSSTGAGDAGGDSSTAAKTSTTSASGKSSTASAPAAATAASVAASNDDSSTAGSPAAASTPQYATTTTCSPDRMSLYLGIGGLGLAFILGLAIYLWWRQGRQPPPDRARRWSERYERSLGKPRPPKRPPRPLLSVLPPSRDRAALLLSAADFESGASSPPSSAGSTSSGYSVDERGRGKRGRRRKGGAG